MADGVQPWNTVLRVCVCSWVSWGVYQSGVEVDAVAAPRRSKVPLCSFLRRWRRGVGHLRLRRLLLKTELRRGRRKTCCDRSWPPVSVGGWGRRRATEARAHPQPEVPMQIMRAGLVDDMVCTSEQQRERSERDLGGTRPARLSRRGERRGGRSNRSAPALFWTLATHCSFHRPF